MKHEANDQIELIDAQLIEITTVVPVESVSREEALLVGGNWAEFANSTAMMIAGEGSPFLAAIGEHLHRANAEERARISYPRINA